MLRPTGVSLLACLFALALAADEVHVRDGRVLVGKVTDEGDHVRVRMKYGEVTVPKTEVLKIVPQETPEERYEAKKRELAPRDGAGWWALARWCQAEKLEALARAAAREAVKADPDHAEARQLLGLVKVGERWVDAREAERLKDAQQAAEMRAKGLVRLGERWVTPADYREAFQRAASRYNQANELLRAKQWKAAIAAYEEALAIFPDLLSARQNMAMAWVQLGQGARAAKILRELVQREPTLASPWYNLGLVLESLHQFREAFDAHGQAAKLNPRLLDATRRRIDLAKRIGREGEARALRDELYSQLAFALADLDQPALAPGVELSLLVSERPILILKTVVEKGGTGLRPVQQRLTSPWTPLEVEKARAYQYRVEQAQPLDSAAFKEKNARLLKQDVYPVDLDAFREGGWAFNLQGGRAVRLKRLRFQAARDGAPLKAPAGLLKVTCFSYDDLVYQAGKLTGGRRQDHQSVWREMKAEDWPEDQVLALPFSDGAYVEIELAIPGGATHREAMVYDHSAGIARKLTRAEWEKAAAGRGRPGPGTSSDPRSRGRALFAELQSKMADHKRQNAGPQDAGYRAWIADWEKRHADLSAEALDADLKMALQDLQTLRAELERDLAGKEAPRVKFYAEEIERLLGK